MDNPNAAATLSTSQIEINRQEPGSAASTPVTAPSGRQHAVAADTVMLPAKEASSEDVDECDGASALVKHDCRAHAGVRRVSEFVVPPGTYGEGQVLQADDWVPSAMQLVRQEELARRPTSRVSLVVGSGQQGEETFLAEPRGADALASGLVFDHSALDVAVQQFLRQIEESSTELAQAAVRSGMLPWLMGLVVGAAGVVTIREKRRTRLGTVGGETEATLPGSVPGLPVHSEMV